jgi:hypothetical protein
MPFGDFALDIGACALGVAAVRTTEKVMASRGRKRLAAQIQDMKGKAVEQTLQEAVNTVQGVENK